MSFSRKVLAKYTVDFWNKAAVFPFTQQGERPPFNLDPDSGAIENDETVVPGKDETESD